MQRGYGNETLRITRDAINFERLPLPAITQHDLGHLPVGVATLFKINRPLHRLVAIVAIAASLTLDVIPCELFWSVGPTCMEILEVLKPQNH